MINKTAWVKTFRMTYSKKDIKQNWPSKNTNQGKSMLQHKK